MRCSALVAVMALLAAMVVPSCGSKLASDPADRLFSVHNALRAMGMTEMGPVSRGSLVEGQETTFPLPVQQSCVTVMVFGDGTVKDVDLRLLDPTGRTVAEDDTHDREAAVRACVEHPGAYVIALRMAAGKGEYLLSSWGGGERVDGPESGGFALPSGGSCDNPTPLVAGHSYSGNTEGGRQEHEGSCGSSSNDGGKEAVFRLEIERRQRVTLELSAQFDSVLYVRKGDCADETGEVACNDDAAGGNKGSRVDAVLDPGTYYVFVDGYGDDAGPFHLDLSTHDAPSMSEVCRAARPLSASARLSGRFEDGFDNAHAVCGRGARGADAVYRFDLPTRARTRLVQTSSDFRGVLHVRRTCEDETSEFVCTDGGLEDDDASWVGILDPGTYWVFADGADEGATGAYTLFAETAAENGGGAPGDTCGDAAPLPGAMGRIDGDTFEARDDFLVSCGARGAPDVVYRLDLAHRSRVTARLARHEGQQVLALTRACGDPSAELGCGAGIDRVVAPGTYYLAVDAEHEPGMGRFSIVYRVRDLEAIEGACAKAPNLSLGKMQSGTTSGAGDKFSPVCAGRGSPRAAPDRVHRFSLPKRTGVRLSVTGQGFSPVLSLRRSCVDDATELKCAEGSAETGQAQMQVTLEAGTYYVVVDGAGPRGEGSYTIQMEELR